MEIRITRRSLLGAAGAALVAACTREGEARPAETFEVNRSPEEWRRILTPQQYAVLRQEATERAGSSPLDREHRKGRFHCAGCNLPVYRSEDKYDSGTGWPSFTRPIPNAVRTRTDRKLFVARTEVHCRRCGGHLGHVFDDGPPPTGKRYCMNGIALKFVPARGA